MIEKCRKEFEETTTLLIIMYTFQGQLEESLTFGRFAVQKCCLEFPKLDYTDYIFLFGIEYKKLKWNLKNFHLVDLSMESS